MSSASENKKYHIAITFNKKSINLYIPDTTIEHLMTFLRRVNKVNENEATYLYLSGGSRMIERKTRISHLERELRRAITSE